MSRIIGLLGAKGAGKSEVAQFLVERHGFVRLRFADGIKDMLRTLGLTEAQIDGSEKESPIPLLGGKTYRDAATTLGTGWGRDMMDADLWTRALEQKLLRELLGRRDVNIVVDDVRHENEAEMVERYGAILVNIRRQSVEPQLNWWRELCARHGLYRFAGLHSSEVLYRHFASDFVIHNDGTMENLHRQIEKVLAFIPNQELEPA